MAVGGFRCFLAWRIEVRFCNYDIINNSLGRVYQPEEASGTTARKYSATVLSFPILPPRSSRVNVLSSMPKIFAAAFTESPSSCRFRTRRSARVFGGGNG